jgi:glycosyltransferase involved in cell wall biosynthesis
VIPIILTLALIVKNEERCILRCLESVKNIVNEIVIVDTGSTDGTKALIQKFISENKNIPIKHLDFTWIDDFAAARNHALENASGKHILFLDADEYIKSQDIEKFKSLIPTLRDDRAYDFDMLNTFSNGTDPILLLGIVRIFPNHEKIRYTRPIHETIVESLDALGMGMEHVELNIFHDGYDDSVIDRLAKTKRNINMLNDFIQKNPDDLLALHLYARDVGYISPANSLSLLKKIYYRALRENNKVVIEVSEKAIADVKEVINKMTQQKGG